MADDEAPASTPTPSAAPSYGLVGQYIRDLSFENPNSPASVILGGATPQINVGINVGVKKQADEVYAVELTLTAKADREKSVLFNVELVYGGVFRVKNIPEAQLAPLLMVDCPQMIFPFARQVLASTVQAGGFPPVMMEPVDFRQIYMQNLRNLQAQQAATQPNNGGTPSTPPAVN
ncbi:MAG: protein-export chaperone SecB [Devosia sp.]